MEKNLVNYNLDIPFKEFMAGQIIDPEQFNDDMLEIEDKVNEILGKHNSLNNSAKEHIANKDNPHETTAHQVGTYTGEEIDGFVNDMKNGGLNPKSIKNEVLADNCVDSRTIANHTITASKVDSLFGGQIDISNNTDITDRYTKTEVDSLIKEKVGEGAYSKEEIDLKFQEVQAGQIVDKTIGVDKLKDDVGTLLDISANKSITDRYTKEEIDVLIRENGLPRDLGSLESDAKQVQLRGGTTSGHESFIGVPREVTIDTDLNTVRVHDGVTPGGHELSKKKDVDDAVEQINENIEHMKENIGSSHNHDNLYSKLDHTHEQYVEKLEGHNNARIIYKNNYYGLSNEGDDTNWLRTTAYGLLPYQSGGYSNIGTNAWRFAVGYFVDLYANKVITDHIQANEISIPGGGSIKFNNDDKIWYNDVSNTFEFRADITASNSETFVDVGTGVVIGNRRIYIGSSFPSSARVNDILIQI